MSDGDDRRAGRPRFLARETGALIDRQRRILDAHEDRFEAAKALVRHLGARWYLDFDHMAPLRASLLFAGVCSAAAALAVKSLRGPPAATELNPSIALLGEFDYVPFGAPQSSPPFTSRGTGEFAVK